VQQAHADYYAALAVSAQPHLVASAELASWLALLEREHHNLRAALAWIVETAEHTHERIRVRAALELTENLQQFWYIRGYLHEARHWLDAALALSQEADELHALILNRVGKFARVQGDIALAQSCHEQALIIQEQLGDESGLCRSLENLAILTGTKGDYGRACELLEQTLAIRRRNGEIVPVISTLNNLAIVLRRLGDLAGAERLYLEGTQLCRENNNLSSLSYTLHGLGEVSVEQGNPEAGLVYFRESISLRYQLGDRPELAISLGAIGMARIYLEDAAGAARLFAASERLREELGITPAASYQAEAEAKIGYARALLGEEAFAQAWREGQALSLAEAVRLALA
jgi:tetratricopeptide (TPR) repeat protein